MAYFSVGPAFLLIGDPTTTSGADMTDLGDTETITVDLGTSFAFTSTARRTGSPLATGLYQLAPNITITAELKDSDPAIISELILNGTLTSGTIGFGDDFTKIASPPTVCIIPVEEKDDGASAAHGIWIPAAFVSGVNGIAWQRVTEGEINVPYTIEIRSAYRETDQDAAAITAGFRFGWMGPPTNAGAGPATWSLPTLT